MTVLHINILCTISSFFADSSEINLVAVIVPIALAIVLVVAIVSIMIIIKQGKIHLNSYYVSVSHLIL